MPTTLDIRLIPKVNTLINKYGKPVTFTRKTPGAYNPATLESAVSGTLQLSAKVTPPQNFDSRYVDGDMIRRDDLQVILAAKSLEVSSFTPRRGDEITISGETFRIEQVSPIYSGEQIAAYTYQLRR